MLFKSITNIFKSHRIYGIGMGDASKVLKISQYVPFPLKFVDSGKLMIYSINFQKLLQILPIIQKHRGTDVKFLSLQGIKDLVLKSTGKRYPLLHLQFPCTSNYESNQEKGKVYRKPVKNFQYMFCCHESDPLKMDLDKCGIFTDIFAKIISANMDNCDWKFVSTADI